LHIVLEFGDLGQKMGGIQSVETRLNACFDQGRAGGLLRAQMLAAV
jgi:hypothetical protein